MFDLKQYKYDMSSFQTHGYTIYKKTIALHAALLYMDWDISSTRWALALQVVVPSS